MVGIVNGTNITMQNITDIANVTSYSDFLINVNDTVYGGWFYFILMLVLWIILYFAANDVRDQPLNNAMYSGAVVTIVGFFVRTLTSGGSSLLTDFQLWIFPLVTIILATIVWAVKD